MKKIISAILFLLSVNTSFCQDEDKVIHTKEGSFIGEKKMLVMQCKENYAAPAENKMVTQICECQVNLLDRRYTTKQIKTYDKKYKLRGLFKLMNDDTLLQRQLKECTSSGNKVLMISIPGYRQNFITKCVDRLKLSTTKPVNDTLATLFCSCTADVMEKRKITLERFDDLGDPNSFLYNEIAYKCGSPFLEPSDLAKEWKPSDSADISGKNIIDSVPVITIGGMHKIKITIGKEARLWMIDTGASDLLVSDDFLKILKQQGVISELNYAGEGKYSLADDRLITSKRYKIDSLRIGHFIVNNIILSSSKNVREFLLGKALLNKFTEWMIDNKNNLLILKK